MRARGQAPGGFRIAIPIAIPNVHHGFIRARAPGGTVRRRRFPSSGLLGPHRILRGLPYQIEKEQEVEERQERQHGPGGRDPGVAAALDRREDRNQADGDDHREEDHRLIGLHEDVAQLDEEGVEDGGGDPHQGEGPPPNAPAGAQEVLVLAGFGGARRPGRLFGPNRRFRSEGRIVVVEVLVGHDSLERKTGGSNRERHPAFTPKVTNNSHGLSQVRTTLKTNTTSAKSTHCR